MAKLTADGSALVYSSYLGGSSTDSGGGIAVDAGGNAYVTGATFSDDFHTPGAFQITPGGSADAFVTKLSFATTNTPKGDKVEVKLGQGKVTLTFAKVTEPGDTTLTTSPDGPPPPVGFKLGDPPTYYDLTTTAIFDPDVIVCINYAGIVFDNTANLRLFHFEDSSWKDVTITDPPPPAPDTICGRVTSLSSFAIFEPAIQQFAAFDARVEIKAKRQKHEFKVKATFTLGAASDGIDPLTEPVSFQVGTYSETIPAGYFTQDQKGRFKFKRINGVALEVVIRPLGGGGFEFKADGQDADLTGTVNPVEVSLTIGDDSGGPIAATGSRSRRNSTKFAK